MFYKNQKSTKLKLNKIYLGDCKKLLKFFPSDSVDLIICDPPYLSTKEKWDKNEVFNEELIKELYRLLKETGNIYVWCGIGEKSQSLIRWFSLLRKYFYFKDLITLKKQRGYGMRRGWLYVREEIMWFVKNNRKFIWNKNEQYGEEKSKYTGLGRNKKGQLLNQFGRVRLSEFKRITNIWTDIKEKSTAIKTRHFTQKPLKAIERIIKLHTRENDIVLDPFLGSGTTALAARNLKRNWIGIEIDKNYVNFALERLMES